MASATPTTTSPFQQFDGVNVNLVNTLTVVHPLLTEADAGNYLARLEQVGPRIDEAIAEGRRISAKGLIPPRFILNLTIVQMQQFIGQPAGSNPLVTTRPARRHENAACRRRS